jgi:hypothetical protein
MVASWVTHWRKRYSLISVLMLEMYPYSLELAPLLEHASKVSHSRAIAKALKSMVDAHNTAERSAS